MYQATSLSRSLTGDRTGTDTLFSRVRLIFLEKISSLYESVIYRKVLIRRSNMAEAMILIPAGENEHVCNKLEEILLQPLLSTTYLLNKSGTKKVVIGLDHKVRDEYEPVIQFFNVHNPMGLTFDIGSWEDLQSNMDFIREYLNARATPSNLHQPSTNRIPLKCFDVLLTTSYGSKAIALTKREGGDDEPSSKKLKKPYTPMIVMQKRTFDGLREIVLLIDEQYRRLQRITRDVNYIVHLIKQEIQPIAREASLDFYDENSEQRFKFLLLEKREILKKNVLEKLGNDKEHDSFLKQYFDIVFTEIIVLHHSVIYDEIHRLQCIEESQEI